MRTTLIALVAVTATTAPPAVAQANDLKPDCPRALVKSAQQHRRIVVKRHGVRTAGRDIVRRGVIRRNQHATPARCGEIRRYRNQLVVLHTQPKYHPLIVRTATRPYRPPAGTMTPSVAAPAGGPLASIRSCESGGSGGYSAVSPSGQYRGAYQFDYGTWASVGGTGDPAAASPAEQDRRAAMLYARSGSSPWPVCG
jgi:hypothetical protein